MNKKWLVGALVGVFLLGNASAAWAGTAWKEVKAIFNPSIKVELNGQEVDGIQALQYNGSLYVPAKSISDMFGLNSTLKFDTKLNKLTVGGPMYVNLYGRDSSNTFQIIINGNWRPSLLTNDWKTYSNYYMGVDFRLESAKGVSFDDYVDLALKGIYKGLYKNAPTKGSANTTIAGAEARVMDYESSDSVGKLVFIHKDSDFATLTFFVDKTRYKASDMKEYDKIVASLNIQ